MQKSDLIMKISTHSEINIKKIMVFKLVESYLLQNVFFSGLIHLNVLNFWFIVFISLGFFHSFVALQL